MEEVDDEMSITMKASFLLITLGLILFIANSAFYAKFSTHLNICFFSLGLLILGSVLMLIGRWREY